VIRRALAFRSSPLVFGLGLSKTGDDELGRRTEAVRIPPQDLRPRLARALAHGPGREVFRGMEGYSSFEDWPYALMYDELMHRYGRSASYVLTVRRSPEVWLESLMGHAMCAPPNRARYH
jgi:sulfotransferase family protein